MKHRSTRQLFDYWNKQRGLRAAPERADIEPGAIRSVLADTFILAVDGQGGHPFRIAGTRVCAAFGRELKNQAFLDLWRTEHQGLVRDVLTTVTYESIGVVASASAATAEGTKLEFELVVLPLKQRGRTDSRVLGALAPTTMPDWFGMHALGTLTLGTHRYLGAGALTDPLTRLAPTLPEGRMSHGFVVYDGGQS